MSHFAVVVIGDNHEEQLAPYHEYECTGENDQFIQDVDETEEYREQYEGAKTSCVVDEMGTFFQREDARFWKDATEEQVAAIKANVNDWMNRKDLGFSYRAQTIDGTQMYQVYTLPFGHIEATTHVKNLLSFREYIKDATLRVEVMPHITPADPQSKEHMWGYTEIDENGEVIKTIRRTNPNAKWDWWVVGGRWTGFFKMKEGEEGSVGRPGLMTEAAAKGFADQALKSQIDFAGMRDDAAKEMLDKHEKVIAAIAGEPFKTWKEIREAHEGKTDGERGSAIEDARVEYHAQQAVKNLRLAKLDFFMNDTLEFAKKSKEQVEKEARNEACVSYAVLKDGKWFSKGEMGWFGVSDDTMTDEQWSEEFTKLIESLPDDTMLTVIDCHI